MGMKGVLRLLHWGPILALSVIGLITTSAIICNLQWWPVTTLYGAIHMAVFLTWNILTLYNFFTAAFNGPGHVAFGWKPDDLDVDEKLQYCKLCEAYKAPRSHHCRKCDRCVLKMDHHCPWINNCVGYSNHANFTMFLFFAPCGCFHALCILIPSMYRAVNREYYMLHTSDPVVTLTVDTFIMSLFGVSLSVGVTIAVGVLLFIQTYYLYYGDGTEPLVHLSIHGFIVSMFAVGLSIGVILAVGALLAIQMKSIIRNETGIESWIIDKSYYRDRDEDEPEFVFPYHRGRWENLRMVLYWKTRPELNGIWWPVREGCDQYTLTVEQIKQKREKKDRSMEYVICESYSGTICPVTKGLKVCCCPPCTDEPRIKLAVDDRIIVSRWKKRWLYGDKVLDSSQSGRGRRIRGWFPRRCAAEIINGEQVGNDQSSNQASPPCHNTSDLPDDLPANNTTSLQHEPNLKDITSKKDD